MGAARGPRMGRLPEPERPHVSDVREVSDVLEEGDLTLSLSTRIYGMVCGVCGGRAIRTITYRARDDADRAMIPLPGIECESCGAIQPDAEKIASMSESKVPSSVRLRCARMRSSA